VLETRSEQVSEYFESGDKVVVLGHEVLRIRSTGEEYAGDWCTVIGFRGKRIASVLVIEDHSPLWATLVKGK